MNSFQRASVGAALGDVFIIHVVPAPARTFVGLLGVSWSVAHMGSTTEPVRVSVQALRAALRCSFSGQPLFKGQTVFVRVSGPASGSKGANLRVTVQEVAQVDPSVFAEVPGLDHAYGLLGTGTALNLVSADPGRIRLVEDDVTGSKDGRGAGAGAGAGTGSGAGSGAVRAGINSSVFQEGFDCRSLGIGGLTDAVFQLLRRGFLPRLYPDLMTSLGIHVPKGAILYGAPGCGKTLIARKLAGAFVRDVDLKVVNGPSLLNKYVGESERNMREVFQEALEDHRANGDDAKVHIIIFDEIDALCKKRGTSSGDAGVGDNVVTQLLTMLDGVEALPNIFVFGLTNRFDLLDEALTRSGRLEIHIEIGLPDVGGRRDILGIHLAKAMSSGHVAADVDLQAIAEATANFTGAELEGLIRDVNSLAMVRCSQGKDLLSATASEDMAHMQLAAVDFQAALAEFTPQFGPKRVGDAPGIEDLVMEVAPGFPRYLAALRDAVASCRGRAGRTCLLVEGSPGAGKSTAVGAVLADLQPQPISNQQWVSVGSTFQAGMTESRKAAALEKVFADARTTTEGVVVVENVETVIEWSRVGPRFSNTVLQALVCALSADLRPGCTLVVVLMTRNMGVLRDLELLDAVDLVFRHPDVETTEGAKRVCERLCPAMAPFCDRFEQPLPFRRLQKLCQLAVDVREPLVEAVVQDFCGAAQVGFADP
jgi:SpoVK/Ycf46/Vps4 family AAA+-type ATPase